MLPTPIEGYPPEIKPDGLSAERRWYLYNDIREFCDEKDVDVVCPRPAEPARPLGK